MKKVPPLTRFMLVLILALIMLFLHNNFWSWQYDTTSPLLFGFMPFAFYHYVIYAAITTAAIYIVISLVWPDPPEDLLLPEKIPEKLEEDKYRWARQFTGNVTGNFNINFTTVRAFQFSYFFAVFRFWKKKALLNGGKGLGKSERVSLLLKC